MRPLTALVWMDQGELGKWKYFLNNIDFEYRKYFDNYYWSCNRSTYKPVFWVKYLLSLLFKSSVLLSKE